MNDQQFARSALGVIGALVGITIIIIIVANVVVEDSDELAPEQLAQIEQRIQPVAQVVTDPDALMKTSASAPAESLSPEQVNQQVCAACHGAGVLGAPVTGDAEAWGARLSDKGREMLVSNAINGINQMPARGGNPDLSDEDIAKTVEYMLEQAGL